MTHVTKLTKNELKEQQSKLNQLQRYLPTLQLKKALLQAEIADTRHQVDALQKNYDTISRQVEVFAGLLTQKTSVDIEHLIQIKEISKRHENIAGIDVPIFEDVSFEKATYSLFETPIWVDSAVKILQSLMHLKAEMMVVNEKKHLLEQELREVSIRVNLFEKILIPRCLHDIKKIKVFLGDQQLTAVSQAKIAKTKMLSQEVA